MAQFSVYQINLSKEYVERIQFASQARLIEAEEFIPFNRKRDLGVFGPKSFQKEDFNHYSLVAQVEADDLNDVFRITNVWDEPERVDHVVGRRMHSTSVGDIIYDGVDFYMIAPFGFTKVEV